MDISRVQDKINENTAGILPIHLFSQMCDMDSIMKIANQYDLKVLEDIQNPLE